MMILVLENHTASSTAANPLIERHTVATGDYEIANRYSGEEKQTYKLFILLISRRLLLEKTKERLLDHQSERSAHPFAK